MERPQNGANSHVLPGSTVAHRVEAKHMPGKSANKKGEKLSLLNFQDNWIYLNFVILNMLKHLKLYQFQKVPLGYVGRKAISYVCSKKLLNRKLLGT